MTVHEQMCTPVGLLDIAKEWWDCEVPLDLAERLSAKYIKNSKHRVNRDTRTGYLIVAAGPLIWLKTHLNDLGLLPVSGEPPPDDSAEAATATFHVGFIALAETEEMLLRLKNEEPATETNRPARSKMFETAQKQDVAPIDALAGTVARAKTKNDTTRDD